MAGERVGRRASIARDQLRVRRHELHGTRYQRAEQNAQETIEGKEL